MLIMYHEEGGEGYPLSEVWTLLWRRLILAELRASPEPEQNGLFNRGKKKFLRIIVRGSRQSSVLKRIVRG